MERKNLNRESFIEHLDLKGLGIEIGVQSGNYSESILKYSDLHLILLDSWRYIPEGYEGDWANFETKIHRGLLNETLDRLIPLYEGRFTLIRELSEKMVIFFKDDLFDFIYLDANHKHNFVQNQLKDWWPKLKTGGVMAGHDYENTMDVNGISVKKPVDEFFAEKGIEVETCDAGCCATWFVFKN